MPHRHRAGRPRPPLRRGSGRRAGVQPFADATPWAWAMAASCSACSMRRPGIGRQGDRWSRRVSSWIYFKARSTARTASERARICAAISTRNLSCKAGLMLRWRCTSSMMRAGSTVVLGPNWISAWVSLGVDLDDAQRLRRAQAMRGQSVCWAVCRSGRSVLPGCPDQVVFVGGVRQAL